MATHTSIFTWKDEGVPWAAPHGVTKSHTGLSNEHTHSIRTISKFTPVLTV